MNLAAKLVPVFLVAVIIGVGVVRGHVGLTFPPARKYDLDFLDNARTKPPCGMPKGRKTFLMVPLFFNICLNDYFEGQVCLPFETASA